VRNSFFEIKNPATEGKSIGEGEEKMEIVEIIRQAVCLGFIGAISLGVLTYLVGVLEKDSCNNLEAVLIFSVFVAFVISIVVVGRCYYLLCGGGELDEFAVRIIVIVIMSIATILVMCCCSLREIGKITTTLIVVGSALLLAVLSAQPIGLSHLVAYIIFWILTLIPKALLEIGGNLAEKEEKVKKVEKQIISKSEQRIISNAQKKSMSQLIHRAKEESSSLIPMADEEMAEMVDAIRKKSHESYNDFMGGKTEFEIAQGVLEEAISDLLALKEMVQPKNSDSITFYDILGVEADESPEEISKAYKKLIRLVHPDTAPKGTNEVANNITSLVNSVYDNLERRAA